MRAVENRRFSVLTPCQQAKFSKSARLTAAALQATENWSLVLGQTQRLEGAARVQPLPRREAPAAAPNERVLLLVPVDGSALDDLLDLGPGVEPPVLEGQRAEHLPSIRA